MTLNDFLLKNIVALLEIIVHSKILRLKVLPLTNCVPILILIAIPGSFIAIVSSIIRAITFLVLLLWLLLNLLMLLLFLLLFYVS